jgi:glycosyltransferase involved in cell wall biosynthesis
MGRYMVTITVLMPVFDTRPDLLEQAIASILSQTYLAPSLTDFEFLIVDDGSERAPTRECLVEAEKRDRRIRVVWNQHRGITRTLNAGLALARGEWIARQDADDWSEPGRLAAQLEFCRVHPDVGVCGTAAWTHQEDGVRLWRKRLPLEHSEVLAGFWTGNPFVHGSVMFRRAPALSIGGYREEFGCSQDYDFLWRLAESAGAANLGEALYHYRYASGSISARRAAEQAVARRAAQVLALARRRGETEDVAAALAIQAGGGSILEAGLKQADHAMLAGAYGQACRDYLRLLRSSPASALAWAKLARCGLFVAVPPMRELCFR